MKPKFLLFIALIALCIRGSAQLDIGSSVVTKSADDATSRVVEIFDVSNTSYAEQNLLGDNWGWGTLPNNADHITKSDWIAQNLGQVFGIATNTTSPNHLIYVATTQIYAPIADANYEIGGVNNSGYKSFDGTMAGNDNAVLIWALNPVTGAYNALVFSTLNNASPTGDNHMFNRGTGIGNICYDKNRNRIYATNMEDGGIYTIDASTGNVLSRYYPTFNSYSDSHAIDHFPSFAKRGDLLWGIAYYHDKIYFARWRENIWNIDASNDNEVHSVEINGSGLLDPITEALFSTTPIPHIPNTSTTLDPLGDRNYSNPIADIEISLDGQQMLLAERTMGDTHAPSAFTNASGGTPSYPTDIMFWAHKSRVLRYDYNNSTDLWEISNNNYYVGNLDVWKYKSTNCTGGVDFNVPTQNTSARYWATGDALEYNPNWFGGDDGQVEYGLAGIPENGNNYYHQFAFPNDDDNVENNSIYLHIFSAVAPSTATGLNVKTHPGDVDIFRVSCAVEINPTNLTCYGDMNGTATAEVTDGVGPYTYEWDNGSTNNTLTNLGAGTYTVTITDVVGCTAEATTTITEPVEFKITLGISPFGIISCPGACDGELSVGALNSGVPPFTYQWTENGAPLATTSTISNLCPALYSVTVTDANGCTASTSIDVENPHAVEVTAVATDATCEGNDGGVTLTVTSGATFFYSYLWSNSSTDDHLSNVGPGTYTVTVTTTNGCTGTATATVGGPPALIGNISMSQNEICVGEEAYLHLHLEGTGFAQFTYDGVVDNIFPYSGPLDYDELFAPSPDDLGVHDICLTLYSANPEETNDYCSKEICISAEVKNCGCDLLAGNAHIDAVSLPNMKYEFHNSGTVEATYLTWLVDGVEKQQTNGDGTFGYQFDPGHHTVCMDAAYVLTNADGSSTCCIVRDCIDIDIDACEYLKATDDITYTLDPNNYHNAIFTFTGSPTPYVLTVVWHFGDGMVAVNDGSPISHSYMDNNNGLGYQVCATIICSHNGVFDPDADDLEVCCCVDEICLPVTIDPCNARTFDINIAEELNQYTTFQVLPSAPISQVTYMWSVDNTILYSGPSAYFGYNNPPSQTYTLCVEADYYTDFPNETSTLCKVHTCETFDPNASSNNGQGLMRFYPNPTNGLLTVEVNASANDNAKLELTDNIGRPMIVKEYSNMKEGNNQLYINLRDLVDGLYLMKVTVNKKVEVVKVIKN